MEPNLLFDKTLIDNQEKFGDDFFQQFELRHRATPLQLNDDISKNYLFPTFYADASCAIAIFHCDYQAARAMMPDSSMQPIKMLRGRSLVIFSCYEYRNVMNVPPYNEIAMTIPVVTDDGMNIPVLSMLLGDKMKSFGYYVFSMPVTSLENRIRGRKIWGLPKDVEHIDISTNEQYSTIKASLDGDAPYLELNIPLRDTPQVFDVKSNLYSVLENERLTSTTQFKGTFNVTRNMGSLFNKCPSGDSASIKLGAGAQADMLRALKIESQAFQFRYSDSINACFDLPHERCIALHTGTLL
jgi:hypothetical protein